MTGKVFIKYTSALYYVCPVAADIFRHLMKLDTAKAER